jgi:hypothetical protein
MSRSLNSPLFDDEDFEIAEQGVREALEMKAQSTSIDSLSLPTRTINQKPNTIHRESETSLVDENMMDVKGLLDQLLNDTAINSKAAINTPIEVTHSVAQNEVVQEIPEFLKRDYTSTSDLNETDHSNNPKFNISWKFPYVIIGGIITIWTSITGIGYSALFTFLTMLPMMDIEFYKRRR